MSARMAEANGDTNAMTVHMTMATLTRVSGEVSLKQWHWSPDGYHDDTDCFESAKNFVCEMANETMTRLAAIPVGTVIEPTVILSWTIGFDDEYPIPVHDPSPHYYSGAIVHEIESTYPGTTYYRMSGHLIVPFAGTQATPEKMFDELERASSGATERVVAFTLFAPRWWRTG